MSLAAFNAYQYPSVTQWQGWTLHWFGALADDTRMWQGVIHSLVIATGVILISLPLGLAGALILTRLQSRWNGVLYGIMVSPVLTPGIILGISTLIFWQNFGVGGGKWVATVAQSTLHRVLLDADVHGAAAAPGPLARGGGARPRRLADAWCSAASRSPFLAPTLFTAAVIGFLQSIENYNTTVFAIGGDWTLVTEIGSRFRFGLSPVINVIGVIFVVITVIAAAIYVLLRQRELQRAKAR